MKYKYELLFCSGLYGSVIVKRIVIMWRYIASIRVALVISIGLFASPVIAETPESYLATLKTEASAAPGFMEFSADRGAEFYKVKHGSDWSCASCHTDDPTAGGKHAKSDKLIKPLAPSVNPKRFTKLKKIKKWFRRNCNDVLDRECTAQEKGDFLAYLLTIKN